jgi:hypothetical protein
MTVLFGGASGFYSDAAGPSDAFQRFAHYMGSVWVDDHDPPTGGTALMDFDILSARPDYEKFLESGERVPFERGLTLDQAWLLDQVVMHTEYMCVISTDAPEAETPRISRKTFMQPSDLSDFAAEALLPQRPEEHDASDLLGFVWHEMNGHAITITGFDRETAEFQFFDPWPGESLLAAWAPEGAVREDRGPERLWRITDAALSRLVYAIFVRMPLWTVLHGQADALLPAPKLPAPLSNDERRRVMDLVLVCTNAGLLDQQAQADFEVLLQRPEVFFDRDSQGATLLDNLWLLVRLAQQGGPAAEGQFREVLHVLTDPSSIHQ